MLTAQAEELLKRLRTGKLDSVEAPVIEQFPAREFLAELEDAYRFTFQEREIGNKWETGLARSLRRELVIKDRGDSLFPLTLIIPVLRNCLFLSGEGDCITGIATANRMAIRPVWKPSKGLAISTGRGFKLDKTPDGWEVKPRTKRTVRLTEEFLRKRGWKFDFLRHLV